jgi:hypothetical protein
MAIYQAPRRRWRLALVTGLVGALIGLGAGVALRTQPEPVQSIRTLDRELSDAASALDVLVIHREADTRSTADPQVAEDAVRRTRARVDRLRTEIRALDPDALRKVDRHLSRLDELVEGRADPEDIAGEAEELAQLLREIIG